MSIVSVMAPVHVRTAAKEKSVVMHPAAVIKTGWKAVKHCGMRGGRRTAALMKQVL